MPKHPYRSSPERGKDGYPTYPLMLTDQTWFYEETKGITLCHEFRDDKSGVFLRCDQIRLPWDSLASAVDNHRRVQRKRTRNAKK